MSEEEIKILKVLINNKDIFYYEDDFNNRIRPLVGKLLNLYEDEKEKNRYSKAQIPRGKIMNEEENNVLEYFKNKQVYDMELVFDYIPVLLNLIENQQKELNNIKEIEKSHKEENGLLRQELEQYKLLEANIDKANKIIDENKFDEGLYGLLMQEKEKSKELEEKLKIAKQLYNDICDVIDNDDGACLLPFYNNDDNIEEKVKQYFEKKAEE